MSKRCLYCYQPLAETQTDFHAICSKRIFGEAIPPSFPYNEYDLESLAKEIIQSQIAVTGVQPKLSLHVTSVAHKTKKFTIVGLWGGYILKPPSSFYPQLPEVEDLTMHLASLAKIKVVPHSLIRLTSGNLAYITKRIDRIKQKKLHMEDMCQLTEKLTEDKYQGSHKQIAKAILKYCANPRLDLINFFELVLFSFLTGNADMHLKNFSLIHQPGVGPILSPAYDLIATALVNSADNEDLALTLNGKKRKIKRSDFIATFNTLHLELKQQENIFRKMEKAKPLWLQCIADSFLDDDLKAQYQDLLQDRFARIAR